MVSEKDLKEIISQVLKEMGTENKVREKEAEQTESDLQDITKIDLRDVIELKNPANKAELMKYKKKTPARIGISRAGTRYTTNTMLRFRADHASAVDAVYTDVSEEFLNANNLFTIQTKCHSKDEYMTRPDLGRRLSEESIAILKEKAKKSPKVEIFVSDGLSSTAIEANVEDTLPAIINGLKSYGIEAGTPFFLKYGRVGAADEVSEILDAEVTCVLIGERPGLATSESMSAYITYKGYVGIPESKRTVVSNIHKNGTPASEAGAHIAHIIKKILDAKASGQDLKL
ncbi:MULTISPECIES: ethanolamine ammonia-lyase subunit EutC [Fusobacterium]|mgnify:FL=1|jgi:ethanolamine ammonia-lyase small subunit|uniref:Ethanolamine ammonia-lyase small subunit n=1 Tax=Fusobacterium varium ATCC 27725 TaxID=469618 RepID=A0ABN5JK30_FUSVA|nr:MULTISPECIES: ethanolamine ammonia-lyase subunit EutC [Fusobacterium]AVQ30872.1 ethanolamine ammonia-lyase subunit EutC [Fusobacterium varium ATCC 27725]EES63683.1 ethanolamine ammonia-lyase, light subunit [Fusobacterium varium ATCC 27725]MCD7979959.1 ethanolamine ammonia-lyase subunit EutC [Fusobacterium sp.]MCF0169466.1 ethanolamine ammonia-lyase subunit EutC [Fusobacterium varium]MCF2672123.1 ethanolamine ammonia-lyase subunit EutC [Fusobacterium varium]